MSTTIAKTSDKMQVCPKEYHRGKDESVLSFEYLYIEYYRFHNDSVNTLIHFLGMPLILTSFFGMCTHVKAFNLMRVDIDRLFDSTKCPIHAFNYGSFDAYSEENQMKYTVVNLFMVMWLIACSLLICSDILVGIFNLAYGIGCHLLAKYVNDMGSKTNDFNSLHLFVGIWFVAYGSQLIGHKFIE